MNADFFTSVVYYIGYYSTYSSINYSVYFSIYFILHCFNPVCMSLLNKSLLHEFMGTWKVCIGWQICFNNQPYNSKKSMQDIWWCYWICNSSLVYEVHSLTLTDAASCVLYWQLLELKCWCGMFTIRVCHISHQTERNDENKPLLRIEEKWMSGDDDRGTAPLVMTQRGCSKQVAVDCDWHLPFSFCPLCTVQTIHII